MGFTELRIYQVREGQMDAWIALMEEVIVPFQESLGLVILDRYRGETDDSLYVWLRRFESEEQRVEQYAAVYQSDLWRDEIAPQVAACIYRDTIKVERLVGV